MRRCKLIIGGRPHQEEYSDYAERYNDKDAQSKAATLGICAQSVLERSLNGCVEFW
jgi:hypothetical protein